MSFSFISAPQKTNYNNLFSFKAKTDYKFDLERYAASDLRTSANAQSLLERYPDTSRFMGNLPVSWLENIPKQDINQCTNQVFELFSDFAKGTISKRYDSPSNCRKEMDKFSAGLTDIIGKNTQIEYLNEGTIGRAYKLTVDDESFVVKTFFQNPVGFGYNSLHGKGAEILGAVYGASAVPGGYYADFYFGKFARSYDDDGFMVTKYIDFDNAKISYINNFILNSIVEQPLRCGNRVNNTILDTVVDYGEVKKGKLSNKRQYKIQRLIVQAIQSKDKDKFDRICDEYQGEDLDYVLNTLVNSFTSFLDFCRYKDTDVLSDDEMKILNCDVHHKIFKLINHAISTENSSLYNMIMDKYKNSDELKYVLKLYNKNMPQEDQEKFMRRVRKTEIEMLKRTFQDFGLIQTY